jgi:hypothetical protein
MPKKDAIRQSEQRSDGNFPLGIGSCTRPGLADFSIYKECPTKLTRSASEGEAENGMN